LREVRRVEEAAGRRRREDPPERPPQPEGAPQDGRRRGDRAEGSDDLQPARPVRLLPHDRRRRRRRGVPGRPGEELPGPADLAARDRARRRVGPALLQAELRLRRVRGHGARRGSGLWPGWPHRAGHRFRRGARLLHHHRDPQLRGPRVLCPWRRWTLRGGGQGVARRGETGERLRRPQGVRPPRGRNRRADDLRAGDPAARQGRRATGPRREGRARPQSRRPGRRVLRLDPDQRGISGPRLARRLKLAPRNARGPRNWCPEGLGCWVLSLPGSLGHPQSSRPSTFSRKVRLGEPYMVVVVVLLACVVVVLELVLELVATVVVVVVVVTTTSGQMPSLVGFFAAK